jgi:nucleoid-associated protein YgaU
MGLWDFISGVGKKLGIDHFEEQERIQKLDDEAARLQAQRAVLEKMNASMMQAVAALGVSIENFKVFVTPNKVAKLSGQAKTQADKEKAIQCVGNHAGVDSVDDTELSAPVEAPSVFHTVVKGDTLSLIAQRYYGITMAYPVLATANQPLIRDVDKVEPGWILRVPPIQGIPYTTQQGDTLSLIAKRMYGDPMKYPVIVDANRSIITNPDVCKAGWELTIPVLHALPAGNIKVVA